MRALLHDGVSVKAFVRPSADAAGLAGLDVELCEGDLMQVADVRRHAAGADACFHLAAKLVAKEAADLQRTNVDGSRAVLEGALDAGCSVVVHTSTIGTLSRADGSPAREADARLPPGASEYVRSKHAADEIARALAARGAPVVLAHPSAPVGAWDRAPTFTGRRIMEVLEGKLPRWPAERVNHVYVGDVARGLVLAAARGAPGRSYILAHREGNLTRDEFVSLVARAAGISPPRRARGIFAWLRAWRGRSEGAGDTAPSLACDPSASIAELELPQTPLPQAFAEAVAWFRGGSSAR